MMDKRGYKNATQRCCVALRRGGENCLGVYAIPKQLIINTSLLLVIHHYCGFCPVFVPGKINKKVS